MNQLQIFESPEFGQVRTITEDGKVLFCASDIAKALGYVRPNDAISAHCRSTVKRRIATSQGNMSDVGFITEGDIYRLVVKSQMPYAEQFESWIFDEIVPSVRKHGMYATDELLDNPDLLIQVATALKEEREKNKLLQSQNQALKPKAEFFDAVASSKTAIAIGDVAKVLGIKGVGRNNLFEILREKKVLMQDNVPYQKYIDSGYFRVVEQKYTKTDGEVVINFKTLVYQKGVDYIRKIVA